MNTPSDSPSSPRELLKNSSQLVAVGALAGIALPHVHAAGSDQVNVALIGCGGRGGGDRSAGKLIAHRAFENAEFGEIARKRCLSGFNAIAGKQLGELVLAVDLAGGDQGANGGVAA